MDFVKWMKDANRFDKNFEILMFFTYLCFEFFSNHFDEYNDLAYFLGCRFISIFIVCCLAHHHWKRYLVIKEEIYQEPLYQIAHVHAFSQAEYMRYIRKSLAPYAILMVVIAIGCGCPYSVYPWLSVVYAVCVAGVLYAEGWCEERYFQYKAGRGFYEKKNYALAALDVIVRIAELIVAFVSISVGVIMVWAILGSLFAQDLDESRIVTRTYTYWGSLILIIIAVSLMAVQLLNFGQKIYKRIRWVYVGLIILAVGMLWIEGKFYTEFYEDKIVIADFSGKKEYDYEEIERFEIYEEHESIQMTIYFTDGEKVNLVGNVQETSELYEDKYYSDYNYMADMVERMQERNIPGNLRDVKLIREDVEGLDDQLKEGLEEIILKMGEQ